MGKWRWESSCLGHLFLFFAYFVFAGVPVLDASCIFIYSVVLYTAYFIIMWRKIFRFIFDYLRIGSKYTSVFSACFSPSYQTNLAPFARIRREFYILVA